ADDGRSGDHGPARPPRLPRPPALLHPGHRHGEHQGVKPTVFILLLVLVTPLTAQTLDDFATLAGWTAAPSDGVRLDLADDHGALRLDFDFNGGAGYAVAHKAFALDLPPNWQLSFRIRGDTPVNNLEFK